MAAAARLVPGCLFWLLLFGLALSYCGELCTAPRDGVRRYDEVSKTRGQEIRIWPLIIFEPWNVILAAIFVSANWPAARLRNRTLPNTKTRWRRLIHPVRSPEIALKLSRKQSAYCRKPCLPENLMAFWGDSSPSVCGSAAERIHSTPGERTEITVRHRCHQWERRKTVQRFLLSPFRCA